MAETKTTAKTKAEENALPNVRAKLLAIQSKLFVPKGQKNDFGNYNYRSCEDIEKQVKPLCVEYNCVLYFWDSVECIGNRLFLKANLELIDIDSNTNIKAMGYAEIGEGKKGMDPAQLTGACSSYARKYALAGLFLIDNEKDPDATNTHGKSTDDVTHDTITAQQINAIIAELGRTGIADSVILDFVKKKHLEEITQADYVTVMKKLNKTPDKKEESK